MKPAGLAVWLGSVCPRDRYAFLSTLKSSLEKLGGFQDTIEAALADHKLAEGMAPSGASRRGLLPVVKKKCMSCCDLGCSATLPLSRGPSKKVTLVVTASWTYLGELRTLHQNGWKALWTPGFEIEGRDDIGTCRGEEGAHDLSAHPR